MDNLGPLPKMPSGRKYILVAASGLLHTMGRSIWDRIVAFLLIFYQLCYTVPGRIHSFSSGLVKAWLGYAPVN